MEEMEQKELLPTEKKADTSTAKKEKIGGIIPNVPSGVLISGEPAFRGSSFIRYTEEGESFPWIKAIPQNRALWYKRVDGPEYMPTALNRKKGEEIVFLGPFREKIRRKPKESELQHRLSLPTKEE